MKFHSFLLCLIVSSAALCQNDMEVAGELYQKHLQAQDSGEIYKSYLILSNIIERDLKLPEYNYAVLHSSVGIASKNLGLYDKARMNYEIALSHCNRASGNELTLYFDILINLGILHRHLGEYSMAINYYDEAERILQEPPSNIRQKPERLSLVKLNKAIVLYDLGKYSKAVELLIESKQIKEANDLEYLGSVYFNLARSYQKLGNNIQADKYFKASEKQWVAEYGSSHFELGNVYRDFGQFLHEIYDHKKSLNYYNRALNIFVTHYGEAHSYTANCYQQVSQYYLNQNEYEKALDYVQKSLISICPDYHDTVIFSNPIGKKSLLDIVLVKSYKTKVLALNKYANSEFLKYDRIRILQAALESANEAIQIAFRIQNSYLSQTSRLFIVENIRSIFIDGIEIALQLFESTGSQLYKERAYALAAQSKTLEMNFEIREKRWLYMRSVDESTAIRFQFLKEEINSLSNLIHEEERNIDADLGVVEQLKHELFSQRRNLDSLHNDVLGNRFDSLAFRVQEKTPLKDLQSKLSKDQTVIEYVIDEDGPSGKQNIYIFVVTKNACRIFPATLDSSLNNHINLVHNSLASVTGGQSPDEIDKRLINSLHLLYYGLLSPVEHWIENKNIIIIPDGLLVYVPFELLIRETNGSRSYSEIDFLLYEHAISYSPNSKWINNAGPASIWKRPKITAYSPENQDSQWNSTEIRSASLEIEEILKEFKGEKVSEELTKEVIKEKTNLNRNIQHFAMHSVADSEMTENPYIVLGINRDSAIIRIYDFEISILDMYSPMVVLNSCESGIGAYHVGEGFLSISRSFLIAGTSSVVQTKWPIEDIASSRIITEYYRKLAKGMSKSEALQAAKINYIRTTPNSFTHPHYWAGFQVYGDPSPIVKKYRLIQVLLGIIVFLIITTILFRRRNVRNS